MNRLTRGLRVLPLLLLSPLFLSAAVIGLLIADVFWLCFGRKRPPMNRKPSTVSASVVIPNWNGRDLLEKYLPSVVEAMKGHPGNEVIVVDNGSTDDSVEFLERNFPQVRLIASSLNRGFGGGSNRGIRAAKNDVVVLLNNDMRVAPDFLAPLLEAFTDAKVFAVSCQIFFSDPAKVREETGLTQGWWENGMLRVRHRIDPAVTTSYPCFYAGGGSSAFHRTKFLELGGFDRLMAPFYLEDTDLGYLAWKRGWKVLYEPRSVVYHEHRGTIGKRYSHDEIQTVLKKNFLLFCWKNIHDWPRLISHLFFSYSGMLVSLIFGDSPERSNLNGLWRASRKLPDALRSRLRARRLAVISDSEAFRRPLGGYFLDRFHTLPSRPERLRVLFASPYPICPPVHGGGVFMYQTVTELTRLCELHLVVLLDYPHEREAHKELESICASIEYLVRPENKPKAFGSIVPHAVREIDLDDLRWAIHRQIYIHRIDVLQLEYTNMGQYAGQFRQIPSVVFEHDIYFQSISRGLSAARGTIHTLTAGFEYLRALRYELRMLGKVDRVQVCSEANGDYLLSYLPGLKGRIDSASRAGIDISRYSFKPDGREPETMLFLGSFRHIPNQEAITWFIRQVLPLVLKERPCARLVIVGAEPPPKHSISGPVHAIDLRGFVDDVREPLSRYAVFVCPILSGSGMRVKLLESFSAGIATVSTTLGAEGLSTVDGEICSLADSPEEFAQKVLALFNSPDQAVAMARRARSEVERRRDLKPMTKHMVAEYDLAVRSMRASP